MRAPGRSWSSAATFFSGLVLVAIVAFADGGYFRETWVWTTVALSCLACMVLLLRDRIVLGWLDLATLGALAALVAWVGLSAVWSSLPEDSLREGERGLVYVAAVLAFVLMVAHEQARELLAGVAAAATLVAAYSLGARLFADRPVASDPVQGTLLFEPLGYANALAIVAAVGLLLTVALAAHAGTPVERALWAAAPMLLLPALTLTESRATWLALAAGVGVLLLLDSRRSVVPAVTLVLAVPAAVAVWLTLRSSALTDTGATVEETSEAGRRLALALGALALGTALASLATERIDSRLRRFPGLSRGLSGALAVVLACGVVVAGFRSDRSLGPRVDYWRVAWSEWEENAWLGSGAGTFAEYWRRESMPVDVLDAHSLYVEALAELGPVGLALLVCALGLPVLAALNARRHPLAGVAAGGYTAYVVHAGLDWDWEMPAVTLTGLLCGVALLAAARREHAPIPIGRRGRAGLAVAALAVAALAVGGQVASG